MTSASNEPPPRRLLVLRHGRAAGAARLPDIERPLAARGEQEAAAAGRWLVHRDAVPDLVLCSTARRTRQTCEGVLAELAAAPMVSFESRIYANDVDALLALVTEAPPEVGTILLIGHNPSAHQFVLWLTAGTDPAGFPTGALALLEFPGGWTDLVPGTARLAASWVP